MGLAHNTQELSDFLPITASNDSASDLVVRLSEQYGNLCESRVAEREMLRYDMEELEYVAWKLTGYYGGNRFDSPLCSATSVVLNRPVGEVQDLAREGYRKLTLTYAEEQ